MKKIVTHGINFHNDDLFATATLMFLLKKRKEEFNLVRVKDFNPEAWKDADFILDIGRVYDEEANRFDHHQEGGAGERENGIPYATFGLIWKKFGKEIAGSEEVANYVDRKIVQPIDAEDNGIELYEGLKFEKVSPFVIQEFFYIFCDKAGREFDATGDEGAYDREFERLLPIAESIVVELIEKGKFKIAAREEAQKLLDKAEDKRVIIMDKFLGFDFSEFPEPLLTIYPDRRTKGHWCAKTVKKSDRKDSFEARMYFPKEWAGKNGEEFVNISGVKDAYFCHNARFLAVAGSKEGILKLVEKALSVI